MRRCVTERPAGETPETPWSLARITAQHRPVGTPAATVRLHASTLIILMKHTNLIYPLFLVLVAGISSRGAERPAGIANGYKLLFEQKFDAASSVRDLVYTDAKAWKRS